MTRIFVAGDSTAAGGHLAPMAGWGEMLGAHLDGTAAVVNRARSGESSKSFLDRGLFAAFANDLGPGDLLVVQFGHNDEKPDEERRTEPATTFRQHLARYVEAARAAGARPVLVTPVARRHWDGQGRLVDTHGPYVTAVRDLAARLDVPLIDLTASSTELYERRGPEPSKALFTWLAPGEHPNYPEGSEDDTHFNQHGAREIAALVAKGLREAGLVPPSPARWRRPEFRPLAGGGRIGGRVSEEALAPAAELHIS